MRSNARFFFVSAAVAAIAAAAAATAAASGGGGAVATLTQNYQSAILCWPHSCVVACLSNE